ncbi:MAG: ATP-dependent Clp protease adaptor ClpS [Planctomycetota bacterium]
MAILPARSAIDTETETTTKTNLARPWNVVVHDDPITPMDYVTDVFMAVFGFPKAKAERLMLEVHNSGRSVVWTGARETGETYVQKLVGKHLLATLEPGSN